MAKEPRVHLQLRLPSDLHDHLKATAEFRGQSMNEMLCEALSTVGQPSEREKAAMSILRQQAMADAIHMAVPGEARWDTENRANALLEYRISGGN